MSLRMNKGMLVLGLIGVLSPMSGYPAGFEKVVGWSGKHAGTAGAGVATSSGAEALYFNPAALSARKGAEVSLNFSPTFSKASGPIAQPNVSVEGVRKLSPVFGALGSYALTDQLAFGLGAYVSGGTKAIYEDVGFGATFPALKASIKSDLALTELGAGVSYELMPRLRLGLAWRIMMVKAELGTAGAGPGPSLQAAEITQLSTTRYNGWRLGAHYLAEDGVWGAGATWRTPVTFTAPGKAVVKVEPAGSPNVITAPERDVAITNTFPTQITLGGFYEVAPKTLRLIGEYVWTQYHVNQSLPIEGLGTTIIQNWQNQVNVRFGAEYSGLSALVLRGGYAFTSQVIPGSNARATFSAPGNAHTITAGAGTQLIDQSFDIDVAAEYSMASGTITTEGATPGEYDTNAYALHTGVTYRF